MNQIDQIDFVVTWLDSNDPLWQEEYRKYKGDIKSGDRSKARYRNWDDLFRYWFRSVENYAPWVNKVYLVTNGKFPDWINPNHPKIVMVKHSDFIPEQFLPTFNSCTIELNLGRIEGLSEHFVYFNDDCYLNQPIESTYFFRNGLPCDNTEETFLNAAKYSQVRSFDNYLHKICDVGLINCFFNRREVVRQSFSKWMNPHLSFQGLLVSLFLTILRRTKFEGFRGAHVEQPMLKSTFAEVWGKAESLATISCSRFREDLSLNPYIIRYWQLAQNKFCPKKFRAAKINISLNNIDIIKRTLRSEKIKSVCLNDDLSGLSEKEVDYLKETILDFMQVKFPSKSEFEL